MPFDSYTLFAANAVILLVMAMVFLLAAWERSGERYWLSWGLGNIMLGIACLCYIWVGGLPALLQAVLPNGLLIAGVGMRWRAAREFGGRPASLWLVLGPAAVFVCLCLLPGVLALHGMIFTVVNIVLAVQAAAAGWEFFRDRQDGLPSRYGLVVSYFVMAASFGVRVGEGIAIGTTMQQYLPHDTMLTLHLVVALFFTVASGSFALSVAYERNVRHLKAVAMHDSLTGLFNRGAFETYLRGLIANPVRGGFAVLVFDIDHFKLVNDRYGHAAGDVALRDCARICRAVMPEQGVIARIGGEEFAAVLTDVTPDEAVDIAETIREAVKARTFAAAGLKFRLTVSAGMCHSSNGITDFDALMRQADSGLYAAKHKGRDRVEPIKPAACPPAFGPPAAAAMPSVEAEDNAAPAPGRAGGVGRLRAS